MTNGGSVIDPLVVEALVGGQSRRGVSILERLTEREREVLSAMAAGAGLASQLRPDLVLMDVQMPVMDGLLATREINALAIGTCVVLLSTHESGDFDAPAAAAGAASFIPKSSFSMGVLEEVWRATAADRTSGT